MTDTAISVKNLSKSYRMYNAPAERLKELLHPFGRKYHRDFWALKDVSFDIKKGESVGIIGKNGSGKSTLLQVLCGILRPTSGEVIVNGRISALLELGAGFNPEFTGRENVFLNGSINGISREEMEARFDQIAGFADIGEFIDQPVKTYSSGMYVRLAFAVAINVDPDILIVDEALAVGDMFFQAKCVERIKKQIDSGTTVFFVSHDITAIKSICQKGILLVNGEVAKHGAADDVVEQYFSSKIATTQKILKPEQATALTQKDFSLNLKYNTAKQRAFSDTTEFQKRASYQRIQNGRANFVNVQLLDEFEQEIQVVSYEQNVLLRMAIEIQEDMELLAFGYHIRDKNGVDVVYSGSLIENTPLRSVKFGEKYIVDWKFEASLRNGPYTVACILSVPINIEMASVTVCDFIPIAVQFEMEKKHGALLHGLVHWKNEVTIEKCKAT